MPGTLAASERFSTLDHVINQRFGGNTPEALRFRKLVLDTCVECLTSFTRSEMPGPFSKAYLDAVAELGFTEVEQRDLISLTLFQTSLVLHPEDKWPDDQ